jgi:adenosylcobinamide-phosphate synthase
VYLEISFLAYLIDKIFGEFNFIKHPVVFMGDYIGWFEKHFYKNTFLRGFFLTASLLIIVFIIIYTITWLIQNLNSDMELILLAILTSTTIASKMLYDSVKDIITHPKNIKYLVSRDTKELNNSDINKAAIETYAENFSDGVIAPLFYLLLFGLPGAFVYKAINTLDSMIGYRNERYENFGKFAAKIDDIANYIPSRITAIFIAILMGSKKALFHFYHNGKEHESPNAGHPISAMALAIGVKLGGDTSYFGKLKTKPSFGEGKETITTDDIINALAFQLRFDTLFIIFSGMGLWV